MASTPHRPAFALPFLAALVPLAWLVLRFDFLVDDAFITFRYAQNLAAGEGLVFNLGEAEPVEGYTNLLWMLTMAAVQALGLDPAVLSRVLSAACAVLLLALVVRFVSRRITDAPVTTPAALFLATLPPVAVWATGGLETMPFTLALFATFEGLVGDPDRPRPQQAGLAGVAAVLLRADGFVWVAMVLAGAFLATRGATRGAAVREEGRTRALLFAGGLTAGAVAMFFFWRLATYGEWLPNTARAKVHVGALSLERGSKYVLSLLLVFPSVALAIGLALAGLRRQVALTLGTLLPVVGGCGYLAVVGGDWMTMFRLLVPTLPFVAVLFGIGLARLAGGAARTVVTATCIVLSLLPAFDTHVVPQSVRSLAHFRWDRSEDLTEVAWWRENVSDIEDWILLGKAAALHVEPGESIVLGNIGAIPFYSGLVAHDTVGLTNREPFAPFEPGARNMAGHDRRVPIATFDRFQPTYQGLKLATEDDPYAGLPAHWLGAGSEKFEIEIVPLDEAAGFPPRTVLQKVRNRW